MSYDTQRHLKKRGENMLKKRQSVRFYPELANRLKKMSIDTDIPMNRIVERALEDYLNIYDKKKDKEVKK